MKLGPENNDTPHDKEHGDISEVVTNQKLNHHQRGRASTDINLSSPHFTFFVSSIGGPLDGRFGTGSSLRGARLLGKHPDRVHGLEANLLSRSIRSIKALTRLDAALKQSRSSGLMKFSSSWHKTHTEH